MIVRSTKDHEPDFAHELFLQFFDYKSVNIGVKSGSRLIAPIVLK